MEKTKQYPNFYENVEEANRRLANTVVTYDGKPYYVLVITNHRDDDIFRVYLDPLGDKRSMARHNYGVPCACYNGDYKTVGKQMDKFMEDTPSSGIIRKMMNSPLFNKFRPFDLGMTNVGGMAAYLERQPLQPATQQGLCESMIVATSFKLVPDSKGRPRIGFPGVYVDDDCLHDTIVGDYPTASECLNNLKDKKNLNCSAAFHKHFALAVGPANTLFLCYKTDVIGVLPYRDFSTVSLAQEFEYTKEVVNELNIFDVVVVS